MKNAKRLLSMLLVLSMVLSFAPMTAWATETKTEAPAAEATETEDISLSVNLSAPLLLNAEDVEIDEDDPTIIAVKAELEDMMVLGAEGDPQPMTEEQKQQVLGLYQQYLDHWNQNKHLLGAQTPFFLSYNDTKDELGILGEMLVMAGVSVDVVRAGYMTFDDVTGMIQNFYFGDALGVQLYGDVIAADREDALQAVKDSGAKTMAQKLLVLNDWLAHNATFDMTYIMNSGKEENEKPMIAENPQQHKYYDVVYDTIYDQYEPQIEQMFHDEIYAGIEANMRDTFYKEVIKSMIYDGYISQAKQSEEVVAAAKDIYYQEQYNKALEAEEQKVYDEAYAEYFNHECEKCYDEGEVTTEATCTTAGVKTYTCTICGETKTEDIPVIDHTYVDGICTVCGAEDPDYVPHEHDYEAVVTAPTCTEAGYTTYTCECGDTYTGDEVAATGHNYVEGVCTVCGDKEVTEEQQTLNAEGDEEEPTEEEIAAAEAYAESVVEAKKADIEAAADATAKEAVENMTQEELDALTETIVCGTEEETTQTESDATAYAEKFMEDNEAAITEAGARNYLVGMLSEQMDEQTVTYYMAEIDAQCDAFIEKAETEGVVVAEGYPAMTIEDMTQQQLASEDPMVDLNEDGTPDVTFAQAIQIYSDEAAKGLTKGVLDYWEGSHIGVLGDGYGVCLGYTKAFTYLVQCLNADIYTTNGNYKAAANWKSNEELYYTNGALDINKGYVVDSVRITFDASVTMFGQTEDSFQSDHFWNAVKVDGQWYYIDPCYTDVYGEVMMRDRVETDGYMNHMYFLFSHDTTVELYDGNYKEIKSLYETAANDKGYEDSWFARVKTNAYSDGTNFYYIYDSADLITMMNEFSMDNMDADSMSSNEYKLVYHAIGDTDKKAAEGDETAIGDTDYTALVEFNHPIDPEDKESETVARYLNAEGEMVESELLTKLYEEHADYAQKYPSLAICTALYNNKLYFNISNCILYYDLSTCEVVLVKEYNTVSGQRDDTNAFGGMAFTVCAENQADFTVSEHPIAGMTIKADGNMYVSVATNFAFISGKEAVDDQTSYGYEYEETNYNASYSNFGGGDYGDMMESMGYDTDNNDNDEFMWTANFVETLSMSHLTGSSHNYASVTVAPTCTEGGYTENRCSTCGMIEADSRVETEDGAHDHHYIRFDETYYTTKDDGTTNTGFCYICTECYDAVSEPTEPQQNDMYEDYGTSYEEQMELYEEQLAEYNAIAEAAGHDLTPANATWDTDNNTVTFSELTVGCDCADRNTVVDHLLGFENTNITLSESHTVAAEIVDYDGNCADGGAIVVYEAAGEVEGYKFTAVYELQKEEGEHSFEITWTWTEAEEGGYTATVTADCLICDAVYENVEATVALSDASYAATCTAEGANIYNASAEVEEGVVLTDSKTDILAKLPHELKDGVCVDCGAGTVYRYSGTGRCQTAVAVADAMKEALGVDEFNAIIIANGDNFADALAGSYLAAQKSAPILLYRANTVEMNLEYIQENLSNGGIVYLLGGNSAVPTTMEEQLTAAGLNVKRLSGKTRLDTNLAILEEAGVENGDEILVCTGWNFADSLSASATGLPILLVNNSTGVLTDAQVDFLKAHKDSNLTIIGGTGAVSAELAAELSDYAMTERLSGKNRYATSVLVAERFFDSPDAAVLAYARNFPDGLCGGALAYAMGAPLLLTDDLVGTDGVAYNLTAIEYATANCIEKGAVLGGTGLISDETVETIFGMSDEMSIKLIRVE